MRTHAAATPPFAARAHAGECSLRRQAAVRQQAGRFWRADEACVPQEGALTAAVARPDERSAARPVRTPPWPPPCTPYVAAPALLLPGENHQEDYAATDVHGLQDGAAEADQALEALRDLRQEAEGQVALLSWQWEGWRAALGRSLLTCCERSTARCRARRSAPAARVLRTQAREAVAQARLFACRAAGPGIWRGALRGHAGDEEALARLASAAAPASREPAKRAPGSAALELGRRRLRLFLAIA